MDKNYLTDEVRALIGARSDWAAAVHPVEDSEVRRFFQATMDPHPRYFDDARAAASRYGARVAPPAFPVHAFRTPPTAPDPLGDMDNPDFDGVSRSLRPGLPPVPVPLSGILNGGYEYEFFSYAEVGERIRCRSTYGDITQKAGKSGVMVLVLIHDEYQTADGRPLLNSTNTMIMR